MQSPKERVHICLVNYYIMMKKNAKQPILPPPLVKMSRSREERRNKY